MFVPDNSGMVFISEWLPNPKGEDAKGEWIEISNSSNSQVDLIGWRLTADGKKFFTLNGTIAPSARIVLSRSETKISLKNTDGRLALYDNQGRLVDQVSFLGTAPEGESVNRVLGSSSTFFSRPTPGGANATLGLNTLVYDNKYPLNTPLNPPASAMSNLVGYLLGTALALAVAIMFILKSHEELSHIFFQGDANPRRGFGRKNN
jgi:hypothetical protein